MTDTDITSVRIENNVICPADGRREYESDLPANALMFDPEELRAHIADLELTEEQATELLATIWSIMVSFVDLGFGIHPVQQAQTARNGHVGKSSASLDHESALVVSCRRNFNANKQDIAGPRQKGRRAKRTDS